MQEYKAKLYEKTKAIAEAIEVEFKTTVNHFDVSKKGEQQFELFTYKLDGEKLFSELVSCFHIPIVQNKKLSNKRLIVTNDFYENIQKLPTIMKLGVFESSLDNLKWESYAKKYFDTLRSIDDLLRFIYSKHRYINIYDHIHMEKPLNNQRLVPNSDKIQDIEYVVVMFFVEDEMLRFI